MKTTPHKKFEMMIMMTMKRYMKLKMSFTESLKRVGKTNVLS